MYSFRNDYSEGAHPKVLKALTETNFQQTRGYGAAKRPGSSSAPSAPRRTRTSTSWWGAPRQTCW